MTIFLRLYRCDFDSTARGHSSPVLPALPLLRHRLRHGEVSGRSTVVQADSAENRVARLASLWSREEPSLHSQQARSVTIQMSRDTSYLPA